MTQSLEQLRQTQVARWSERVADWEAFADAKVEGYRRAQHRCEEVFFIRAETVLGPWDCVSCPADVVHGFENVGLPAQTS